MSALSAPVLELQQQVVAPRRTRSLIILAVLFAITYLASTFSPAILDDADATHAEAAREMLVRGDYVTLHVNGIRYLEKAPLPYWLIALSYRVFGVNEFAARLPITLSVLLLGLLAMRWGRRAFGDRAGIYAGLFIFTAIGPYLFTRILIPEALLSLLIASALYFFLSALEFEPRAWRWYAGYACVALAALTKGLVAIVFVAGPAFIYLAVTGDWRRWREFRLVSGILLLIAIAAPWHILAGMRNPRFFWFYFINEHLLRFLGRRYPKDYNKLPALLYWSLHLVWLFPWSFYLPAVLRGARRRLRAPDSIEEQQARFAARTRLLCWIWAAMVLFFFSLSTNQEYYTFPAYLPLLALLADALVRIEQNGARKWLTTSAAVITAISLMAGATLLTGLWYSRHLPYTGDISSVLAKHDMGVDTLAMSHALDLSMQSFAALRLPAALAALALIVAPLLSLVWRARRKHYLATWVLAGGMAVFLIAAHLALVRFEPYLSSRALARQLGPQISTADRVMIYGDQAFGSSLLFYLRRPIELVNGRTTSMWFGSTYPDAPKIFLSDADLLGDWSGGQRIFLFVPPHQVGRVTSLLKNRYVIAESSGKVIYSNRP